MKTRNLVLFVTLLAASATAADVERKIVEHEEVPMPDIALKMNLHGTVRFKVWVAPSGEVRRLEYIGGHPLVAEAALRTIKHWKYERAANETVETVAVKF